jgi:hypothetical protein
LVAITSALGDVSDALTHALFLVAGSFLLPLPHFARSIEVTAPAAILISAATTAILAAAAPAPPIIAAAAIAAATVIATAIAAAPVVAATAAIFLAFASSLLGPICESRRGKRHPGDTGGEDQDTHDTSPRLMQVTAQHSCRFRNWIWLRRAEGRRAWQGRTIPAGASQPRL